MEYFKFFKNREEFNQYIATQEQPMKSHIVDECDIIGHCPENYLRFIPTRDCNFSFSGNDIEYSLDKGLTWNTLTDGSTSPLVLANHEIWWRAYDPQVTSTSGMGNFNTVGTTSDFVVKGNIMSLIYGDDYKGKYALKDDYQFLKLFAGDVHLISVEELELPATELTDNCYKQMFSNCISLVTPMSELPSNVLTEGCYKQMFEECTRLETVPRLPAMIMENNCYANMFMGCTSITTIPSDYLMSTALAPYCYSGMFYRCRELTTAPTLPATTMEMSCYVNMFNDCKALQTAPQLPATTLAENCYNQMFSGCTALTTAPDLPATTLESKCYNGMFKSCSSLVTAPELSATTLVEYCYNGMFSGCTRLNSVVCLATNISAYNCTTDWMYNVASNGTFTKPSATTSWESGKNGIPNGWTVVNV